MIRTYKYRLRPNKSQFEMLDFLLWQSRRIYNLALEQRIDTYQDTGVGLRYTEQWAYFRDLRRENPATFGRLNATSLQQLLRRLDKAFRAFFPKRTGDAVRRLKAGESPGFPRFKGRHRFKSMEYRYGDGCQLRTNEQGQIRFYVQNVGEVKVIYHRRIPEETSRTHGRQLRRQADPPGIRELYDPNRERL